MTINLTDWQFRPVKIGDYTTDPHKWTITRANNYCAITDHDDSLIDEVYDRGQTDLDLVIHGIGWLHAVYYEDHGTDGAYTGV